MSKTFASYNALTDEIMFAICDAVPGAQIGVSSRSISRYVELSDDEGNERRVRISDHDGTASCGGGIVYEIDVRDFNVEENYDDGEFDGVTVHHDWKIAESVEAAIKALRA